MLNRGRRLGTLGWRSRVWRLQAWLVTTSQEARSSSAPEEGAALDGWDLSDEGRRKCRLDNGECLGAPVRRRSTVAGTKIATVERREARVPGNNGTRHLQKVPDAASAVPALILWGEHDAFLPLDTVARPLADLLRASLVLLPGGHFTPMDCPREVATALLGFLAHLPPATPIE